MNVKINPATLDQLIALAGDLAREDWKRYEQAQAKGESAHPQWKEPFLRLAFSLGVSAQDLDALRLRARGLGIIGKDMPPEQARFYSASQVKAALEAVQMEALGYKGLQF